MRELERVPEALTALGRHEVTGEPREVTEGVFGAPASLDAVNSQTGADLLRYSVGDPDQPGLTLAVTPSRRARQSAGTTYCYGVRDGSVIRWTQHTAGRVSLGRRGSAHLILGEHPLADTIGRLTASPHAVSTVLTHTGDLVFDETVDQHLRHLPFDPTATITPAGRRAPIPEPDRLSDRVAYPAARLRLHLVQGPDQRSHLPR